MWDDVRQRSVQRIWVAAKRPCLNGDFAGVFQDECVCLHSGD